MWCECGPCIIGEFGVDGMCAGAVHFVGVGVRWVEEVDDGMNAGAAHCEEVVEVVGGRVYVECDCGMCVVSEWVYIFIRVVTDPDLWDAVTCTFA